jgi:hypothetical protein
MRERSRPSHSDSRTLRVRTTRQQHGTARLLKNRLRSFFLTYLCVVLCSAALAFKTKYDECRALNAATDATRAVASPEKAEKPAETA